jgi:ABC-2 type transport system permease protein
MKASFVYLPAILTLAGVTVLLIGAFPKFTALAWALPVYSFIMLYFGKLFDIPQWVIKISPFEATPQLPVQAFELMPLIILSAIALLLSAAGFYRYRNRDIG